MNVSTHIQARTPLRVATAKHAHVSRRACVRTCAVATADSSVNQPKAVKSPPKNLCHVRSAVSIVLSVLNCLFKYIVSHNLRNTSLARLISVSRGLEGHSAFHRSLFAMIIFICHLSFSDLQLFCAEVADITRDARVNHRALARIFFAAFCSTLRFA